MKLLFAIATLLFFLQTSAAEKDSAYVYNLPDSVKAVSIIADINVQSVGKTEVFSGIKSGPFKLILESDKTEKEISFQFPKTAVIISNGVAVEKNKTEVEWQYKWQLNTTYKLLIASASDSAENFTIYSGYIFLPEKQKWKLIASCRVNGTRETLKDFASVFSTGKRHSVQAMVNNVWCQRVAGPWKRLDNQPMADIKPVINPLPNIDSVQQYEIDKRIIEQAIAIGKSNASKVIEGVYYNIVNAGTGKSFTVADSITVHYQLRIFGSSEIISGSDTESYTFPLKVLIKAWQIAVPLIKTGGKIKLVIPSGLGYSIRTRAPKIPPNSILEFDVEVLDAKPSLK